MGSLNLAPTCVAMVMKLHMEWYTLSKERCLKVFASKTIFDDVLLYGRTARHIIAYLRTVLNPFKHHRPTLKLKRCKCFQDRCKFVEMDVVSGGTQPAQSKNEAAHCDLQIIHPVLDPIRAGHQTLEVHILKSESTRDTISKGGYGTNAEHM